MRTWHNTVSRIIWAAEAAEHKRIEDIQAQLDYDQVVENKHKRKMLQMEQDYKKELDKQKQAYESLLAQQVAKPSTAPAVQPRTIKSPSPHLQGEIDRLTNEITALKSQNKAKVSNMEAVHADRVVVLSEKVDRLAAANAFLRKPGNSEKEAMKQIYEAQLQELTRDRDNLAKTNEGLKKKLPPVQPFIFSAGGGSVSGRSTRSAPSPSPRSPASQESSEGWSRKRARRM
jgi:5-methylcytosine-specific restriction endonuclease McrBC GTP-binding regulatory subunit McrB